MDSVSVDPCTIEPYQFHKGSIGNVSITFTPTTTHEQLISRVHANVGVWLPYPLHNPDPCNNSGLKSPLKPGLEA